MRAVQNPNVHCVNPHAHCANHENHFILGHARYGPCPVQAIVPDWNFLSCPTGFTQNSSQGHITPHNSLYHPPQQPIPNIFHKTLVASSFRVGCLVVPSPPCGLLHLGCLLTLDFGPYPLFLFLSLSWVLSLFYKIWQGFISWFQFLMQIFGQCNIIMIHS